MNVWPTKWLLGNGPGMDERTHRRLAVVGAASLGLLTAAVFFAWESHQGLSLWDEGYLWYGVLRVLAGEVPLRDFQSYDPGRYYWSALLLRLTGTEGILAIRYTLALFQAIALSTALIALAAIRPRRGGTFYLLACALTLAAWMVPRHKLFDVSISMVLVCVSALWIARPSLRNYFLMGLALGLAAYFGKNHGMYGMLATGGILLSQALHRDNGGRLWRGIMVLAGGVVVGYTPMFATMGLAPGFMQAFFRGIKFYAEIRATNLPLPVPSPWHAGFWNSFSPDSLRELAEGWIFLFIPVFGCLSVIYVLIARRKGLPVRSLFVASAFYVLPYAHYAYSRADLGHLAQGIFPTLIGIMVLCASLPALPRALALMALCATSLFTAAPLHPGWQCKVNHNCTTVVVDGTRLRVDGGTAREVALLRSLKRDFAPTGQNIYVTPFLPGAYALLHSRSPTWEIYAPWRRGDQVQRDDIRQIELAKPAFVLIYDISLDGRDELRFRNTHPLINSYIQDHYVAVTGYTDDPAYLIYRPPGVR
ncbi:hypothetical protein [Dyella sp. EPa41]|uniref:hypothetical protein n=1 Tax=Dyella sp. EPa41 TaxID=1561194 RepID=UPI001915A005|nr:hypothetical protein [Dyella sp. EPa41]